MTSIDPNEWCLWMPVADSHLSFSYVFRVFRHSGVNPSTHLFSVIPGISGAVVLRPYLSKSRIVLGNKDWSLGDYSRCCHVLFPAKGPRIRFSSLTNLNLLRGGKSRFYFGVAVSLGTMEQGSNYQTFKWGI